MGECLKCVFSSQVRFDSVGGLSNHIRSLKEMVVFPLLYPEIFEKFKIQPPRWEKNGHFISFHAFDIFSCHDNEDICVAYIAIIK